MGKLKEIAKLKETAKRSTFTLEGRFVGFVGDLEEKPKRLRVATSEGERYVKLPKKLRGYLREILQPGAWVVISGKSKLKKKTGKLKLKAERVTLTSPNKSTQVFTPPVAAPKTKACVMICQKSSCRKRGSGEISQAVTESLRDRELEDEVAIKGTGCMKQCKKGPCLVFMPDKSRYTKVAPKEVPGLVEKHFACKLKPNGNQPEFSAVT